MWPEGVRLPVPAEAMLTESGDMLAAPASIRVTLLADTVSVPCPVAFPSGATLTPGPWLPAVAVPIPGGAPAMALLAGPLLAAAASPMLGTDGVLGGDTLGTPWMV